MVLGGGPPGRLAAAATSPPNCKSPRKDLRVIDLWDFSAELPSARQRNLRGPPLPVMVSGSPLPLPLHPQAQSQLQVAKGFMCGLETRRLPPPPATEKKWPHELAAVGRRV